MKIEEYRDEVKTLLVKVDTRQEEIFYRINRIEKHLENLNGPRKEDYSIMVIRSCCYLYNINGYKRNNEVNMSAWFNWENLFYLIGIIIAGGATFVGYKYKQVVNELREVFKELEKAYEDGKLSDDERKKIMKECLDVAKAVMKVFWK